MANEFDGQTPVSGPEGNVPAAGSASAETGAFSSETPATKTGKDEPESVTDDSTGQSVKKERPKKKGLFGSKKEDSSVDPETAQKNKKAAKKKNRKRLMVLIIILAAGLAIYWAWRYSKKKAEASSSASSQNTATATKQDISKTISSTGTIAAKNTYSITALVSGTIISADFEEGDQVAKGQTLYQIDASSMQSKLTSAQNTLTRAQKAYDDAVSDNAKAQAKYGGGIYSATQSGYITKVDVTDGSSVGNNTALLELTDETSMKVRIPFLSGEADQIGAGAVGTITLSDTLEQVEGTVTAVASQEEALTGGRLVKYVTFTVANPGGVTTTTSASATINGFTSAGEGTFTAGNTLTMSADLDANVKVDKVLVNVGDRVDPGTAVFSIQSDSVTDVLKTYSDAVDSKQAAVESAQQSLDSTQDTIDNYTITAPIAGQVIKKSYKVGDKIGSNSGSSSTSTTLATIYDMSQYTFSMSIDESDVSSITVGQSVNVTSDDVSGKTFQGTVTNISLESSVSNGVSTYPVTVTLATTSELLPGMNVDAEIVVASASDAICIPSDALQRGNKVYIQDSSVKSASGSVPAGFRSVDVTTGLTSTDYVQITSGVSEGDVVYVNASTASSTNTMNVQDMGGGMGGPGGEGGGQGGPPGQ